MGHTNQTANYKLPQFVGTDKPSWLGDINDAFAAIDTAIAAAASEASTADGKADALSTTVSGHTTQIGTLQNTVTSQGNTLNTVTSLIGNGTPTTTDQTIIGAINEVHADQGDLDDLQTTDKSSLVSAINEVASGGSGSSSYTLAGSVINTEASAGGSPTATTLTIPTTATELLIRVIDSNNYVWSSVIGFPTDDKLIAVVLRNNGASISDRSTASFTPRTGVLDITWDLGSIFSGVKAELYYK